jgi:hypothetical protein
MKNLSIAVVFMSALATSAFAADDSDTQSVALYNRVQSSGLNSHVTELSKDIADFLRKQSTSLEDHSGDYYFSGLRGYASWGLRSLGDVCRSNAASSELGALAADHIKSYLAQQGGSSSSSLASYAASWDSASAWKVAGATLRTTGYLLGTQTQEQLAVEEGALYRIIFDFCQKKHIEPKSSNVLPLAATALMLCKDQISCGFNQVLTEYSRLVHKFSERASLEPLANAVVAIDYLVEGICHYEVLDVALRGEKQPLEKLVAHMVAWQIDPSKMLSCTASIDENMALAGKKKEEIGKMTRDDITRAMQDLRKIRMEEFVNGLFFKYVCQLAVDENLNTQNMITFRKDLESKNQQAIQYSS